MQLAGKAAIVTGASSGIDLAAAQALAMQGAQVILLARAAMDRAVSLYGCIDIVINAAGVSMREKQLLQEIDIAERKRIMDTNVTGTFLMCCRHQYLESQNEICNSRAKRYDVKSGGYRGYRSVFTNSIGRCSH